MLVISSAASATSLLPINLQQLSTRASLIFYGEVISNQTRKDPQSGHIATFTEFKIIESIKGETDSTHTIKQLGGYDKTSNIRLRVHGVPVFETGKHYVVFLPEESSLGFCSPLGLHQGSFSVYNNDGEKTISNGRSVSAEYTREDTNILSTKSYSSIRVPLAVQADNPSLSRLDDFINTVRAYNTP
jgi:hypothetical protein